MRQIFFRKKPGGLNRLFIFLLFPPAIISLFAAVSSGEGPSSEQWFMVTIADTPVGYIHETTEAKGTAEGSVIFSASEMKMVFNRLGTKVELRFLSSSEETGEGGLKKVNYEMAASLLSTKSEAVVKDKSVEVRSAAGGKGYSRTISFSGQLLGPEGIIKLCAERLKNPGDKVEFQTFVPELEAVTKVKRVVLVREAVKIGDKEIQALKIEEEIEINSMKGTIWLSSEYELVKQEMSTPFGLAQVILSEKLVALRAAAGGELPEDIYKRSIVRTNIRLPQARNIEHLKIKLLLRSPELGWPEINCQYEKVLSQTKDTLVLEITRPYPARKAVLPAAKTEKNREFLEPNAYIQSDDPKVQLKAHEIVGKEKEVFKAGLKLERWVAENMKFDLGIVLAPSSEIFNNRRGTCMGYATLLATLCRAAGIPSRVVMGYVYALGMFGGHAWTEILIGEEWIPLDAAVVSQGPADAARFYFLASSFYGGTGSMLSGAGQKIFGQIEIKIQEYTISGGKKVTVQEGAKPYSTSGDKYENPWLGLELIKPSDFKFTKLDAVWPELTVLALEGPGGEKIELKQGSLWPWKDAGVSVQEILASLTFKAKPEKTKISRHLAFIIREQHKAALVIIDGLEAWTLAAQGENAFQLLNQIASSLELE